MNANLATVILAAGLSTRMKSKTSKVLQPLAGFPVIHYSITAALGCGSKDIYVVRGPGQDDLKEYLKSVNIAEVVQKKPLGTADAVKAAGHKLSSFKGYVLILCGDVPLVRPEVLHDFVFSVQNKLGVMGVLTTCLSDPFSYGRIVRGDDGNIMRIVEEKDATSTEKRIKEINTGIICAEAGWLFNSLKKIDSKNAKGEFYLTDLVTIAVNEDEQAYGFLSSTSDDFIGINTRVDLSKVAKLMRERINTRHMLDGVGILCPQDTHIDANVTIGHDTKIMPYSFLSGQTKIGKDCIIENGVVIQNAILGNNVHIKAHSVVEDSVIKDGAVVGPFARLRPGTKVGVKSRVGNFVELKKCDLKDGAKANHLTYLGDAIIGKGTNVGCGTITCNYDGHSKHLTTVGENVFIGSDVAFVAPVTIGKGATIGAGSIITENVPKDSLAVARSRQVIVKNWKKRS